ncbi:hypothetical protein QJS10_CPB22g00383 [Acorus calamus]|uniref:Uncharacterized protein n=1 Tax=Acorus calamus TaxID=4465 RepID=A0AAV9BZM6_ACOCL|nr:hypothetical protein QJS10_CPB22g00383 [Acorus calamus]
MDSDRASGSSKHRKTDSVHGSGSGKYRKTHSELPVDEDDKDAPVTPQKNSNFEKEKTGFSSSSESSNEEDFYQLDSSMLGKSAEVCETRRLSGDSMVVGDAPQVDGKSTAVDDSPPHLAGNATQLTVKSNAQDVDMGTVEKLSNKCGADNLVSETSKPIGPAQLENTSVGAVSDLTTGLSGNLGSLWVMQTPPVPVTVRYDVPDPNRIPASVFARSTNQVEWSVASNESLFSIHLGNSSFSRDRVFLLGRLTGEGKSKATEVPSEQPQPPQLQPPLQPMLMQPIEQPQMETLGAAPNEPWYKWLYCFSCCPSCC